MKQGLAAAYVLGVFVEWFHWLAFITLILLLPSSDSESAPVGYYVALVLGLSGATIVAAIDGGRGGALSRRRAVVWLAVSGLQCVRLGVMVVIVAMVVGAGIPEATADVGIEVLLILYLGIALFLFRGARRLGNPTPFPGPERWGLALAAMMRGRLPEV